MSLQLKAENNSPRCSPVTASSLKHGDRSFQHWFWVCARPTQSVYLFDRPLGHIVIHVNDVQQVLFFTRHGNLSCEWFKGKIRCHQNLVPSGMGGTFGTRWFDVRQLSGPRHPPPSHPEQSNLNLLVLHAGPLPTSGFQATPPPHPPHPHPTSHRLLGCHDKLSETSASGTACAK